MAKSGPIEGQLDILKNGIDKAVDSQTYPLHLVAKSGTIAGQPHILKNAIEQAVNNQMYPPQ